MALVSESQGGKVDSLPSVSAILSMALWGRGYTLEKRVSRSGHVGFAPACPSLQEQLSVPGP